MVAAHLPLEEDLGQRLLVLVVDDVAGVDLEGAVEAVEFDPYLLLEHEGGLLGRGEEDLVGVVGLRDEA